MLLWPFRSRPIVENADVAVGNFTLSAQLASNSGRSISVAGYVYLKDDEDSLNRRLDLYNNVIERQRARSEIPELEAKRDQMMKGLEQAKEVLADLEARQRDSGSLSSQERMTLKNLRVNIGKMNEEIDKGTEAIGEAKRKAGVG